MSNTHTTLESLFTDIAGKIREKKNTSVSYVADNFPSAIESISASDLTSGNKPLSSSVNAQTDIDVTDYKTVSISAMASEEKTATLKEATYTVTSDDITPTSGKLLSKVSVPRIVTETPSTTAGTSAKTVNASTGKYIKSITVNPTPSQSKTATPTTTSQDITPDSGKLLSKVTVNAIPISTITNEAVNIEVYDEDNTAEVVDYGIKATVTLPAGYYNGTTVVKTVSDLFPSTTADVKASEVLIGSQFVDNTGKRITGTMPNNGKVTNTISTQGGSYTIPAGYHNGEGKVTASLGNATITSGSGTATISTPSYNATNDNFTQSASGTISAPTVGTAGYISSSAGTKNTNSIFGSKTLSKVGTGVTITGDSTKAPTLKRTAKPTADTWTDAASGAATTTKPTSGVYIQIDADANTGTLTATPKVTSEGYGTTSNYGATAGTATVGASKATTAYVPVTTTSASVSGKTVSYGTGWITGGSKSVADGSAGTPVATKGTVSNNSISVTPSVTNTTGYITGSTKTGTAVTVSASELVSGNKSLSSGTSAQSNIDVTNYKTVSISAIAAGSAGTPVATKGTVSNNSISVTPSVTNTTGYITGSTKTGTAVTVSASELVSGNKALSPSTSAQTGIDVTNYATVSVSAMPSGSASVNNVTVSPSVTSLTYTYNSTNKNYDVTGSASTTKDVTATVGTAGYITSVTKGTATGSASVAATVSKVGTGVDITGSTTKKPSITRTAKPTADTWTDAASGAATTTKPTSGVYVRVDAAANTGTLTATPKVTSAGYGTTSNYGATAGTATVGTQAADATYVPITTTSASVSGKTVSYGTGWITGGSKSVADGSAGTPVATKGTVSNNSISVTPSVTNTTGYITGSTKIGTAVTVSASELVSGNKSLSSGTSAQTDIDVTNYATVSISAISVGSAGTPVATKGAVSNNSISITPSVTNTTGYITGSTKTGTAVTVSASDLVSGNKSLSSSSTAQTGIDVTNYSTVSISAMGGGAYSASVGSHSISTNPVVTPSVAGSVTGISTTVAPSGTDGTDYWTLDPSGSVTTTGKSSATGKATIGTAGYLGTGNKESGADVKDITPTVAAGTNLYIKKASSSATAPTASASAGTASIVNNPSASASTTVTGMVTTTTNTGYKVEASSSANSGNSTATGGSASITAGSVTVGVGYNPSSVTKSISASTTSGNTVTSTAKTSTSSSTTYIQKGALGASVSGSGSASMSPTGFTAASSATDYYVTLSASASATGSASVSTEGYVKSETASSGSKALTVSGNGNKLYIPTGTAGTPSATKGTVSNNSISVTPSVTNTTGYIAGSTKTGDAVTVSASELVSGNKSLSSSASAQSNIDVTNYKTVSISAIPTTTLTNSVVSIEVYDEDASASVVDYGIKATVTLPAGYYNGTTVATVSNLFPSTTADVKASEVLIGSQFVDSTGKRIAGTMPNQGAQTPTISSQGGTYTIPAGYHNGSGVVTASLGNATITSGSASATISTPSYNATNDNFTQSASGTVNAPSVGTAGYISSSAGTKNTNSISGSKTLSKVGTGVDITGDSTKKPSITRTAKPTADTWTDAASGAATTTKPTSGVYVQVNSAANTGTLTATPKVTSEGYGTTSKYGATAGTKTVGASASDATYVPITTTSASVSGKTVSYGTGWITGGSKSVADGSAGTPVATKGTVSNNSISVTPSVTNTTGYITGSTKTGTAVTVSASELVSGNKSLSSGTSAQSNIDVTNYKTVSISAIAAGSAGTPVATKGTVSNNSISVTPSVTNTTGYITGSTKTGTAVTVSASELVSGNRALSSGTSAQTDIDVTNYKTVSISAIGSGSASVNNVTVSPSVTSLTYTYNSTNKNYDVTGSASTTKDVTATVGTAGYITSVTKGTATGSASVAATVAQSTITGSQTLPSGSSVTANVGYGKVAKVSAGYYPSDRYVGSGVSAGSASVSASGTATKPTITKTTTTATGATNVGVTTTTTAPTSGYFVSNKATALATNITVSPSVSAGYITSITNYGGSISASDGDVYYTTLATGSISVSGFVSNVNGSGSVNPGTNTISRTAKPSGDTWTDAASGAATTTKPTSGVYVRVDASTKQNTGIFSVNGTDSSGASATVGTDGYVTSSQNASGSVIGCGFASVTVPAKSSSATYVPITTTSASVSGKTVSYGTGWITGGSRSVADGTAGTPVATKGTVSNNSISVTPSVTNTTGYITGSTKTGTAVTVSASELVSGNRSLSSGTITQSNIDVTNYKTVSISPIAAGSAGTPVATKGTASNLSISVTPSVTNTTGYITGSTKTGTAVTVGLSDLGVTNNGAGGSYSLNATTTSKTFAAGYWSSANTVSITVASVATVKSALGL